jgi:hypothetical protein
MYSCRGPSGSIFVMLGLIEVSSFFVFMILLDLSFSLLVQLWSGLPDILLGKFVPFGEF